MLLERLVGDENVVGAEKLIDGVRFQEIKDTGGVKLTATSSKF